MKNIIKPELLAPAGDFERLKYAILYGADAVYIGGQDYSLRANSTNFSIDEIREAAEFVHKYNKKLYVAVNIIFHNEDVIGLKEYLIMLNECKVDAIIIADPIVLKLAREHIPNMEIHLSTQQSTLNVESAKYWNNEGIKRIVLGRELSKDDIKSIIKESGVEVESFIHGAMCVSYSGRCVLSNYFTNRDSNRGGCSQICRWNFDLIDLNNNKINSDIDFSIAVKDLSMASKIYDLIDLGVTSLKIEGRMRSIYYISNVIHVYRKIIDSYFDNTNINNEELEYELYRCANRDAVVQYFDKKPGVEEQYYLGRNEQSNKDFLALVIEYDDINKEIILEQRNYFKKGDKITIFGPNTEKFVINVDYIKDDKNNIIDVARHPQQIIKIPCNTKVYKDDIVRVYFMVDNTLKK